MKRIIFGLALARTLTAITPQEALDRLVEGNVRYVDDSFVSPDRTSLKRLELTSNQAPFACIVGCSDSRVPPEIVFDQGLGDLFAVRVAGQVVGPVELDSIEYSVRYLGAAMILVLGHESCGAVKAVKAGQTGDIEAIANLMEPAIDPTKKKSLEDAIKANVRYVVKYLKGTPLIKKYMSQGKVNVVGGYYNLSDGHVDILN